MNYTVCQTLQKVNKKLETTKKSNWQLGSTMCNFYPQQLNQMKLEPQGLLGQNSEFRYNSIWHQNFNQVKHDKVIILKRKSEFINYAKRHNFSVQGIEDTNFFLSISGTSLFSALSTNRFPSSVADWRKRTVETRKLN